MASIKFILTDIEGTTTSVSFVYDVLFPYFAKHAQRYIQAHLEELEVLDLLEEVKKTVLEEDDKEINYDAALEKLLYWNRVDRKHPALKTLQGQVWQEGYVSGEIKGHVYEDVPPMLKKWHKAGIQLGVYSSGSVAAQQLIFGKSIAGDLTTLFSLYFDTRIGHKREIQSYRNIQMAIDLPVSQILFLSDVEEELDAALEAGFQTLQLVRERTHPSSRHRSVSTFKEIKI